MSTQDLLAALVERGEVGLAQSLAERRIRVEQLADTETRSRVVQELDLSLEQRAAIMDYIKDLGPRTNAWGYPCYEARERHRIAAELKEFAQLEKLAPPEALAYRRAHFYNSYVTVSDIKPWSQHTPASPPSSAPLKAAHRSDLNDKISVWRGNMCELEIDAVVNAANSVLRGGGGIDGAIHAQAGALLDEECAGLGGCKTGNTKMTLGYKMPAKHILHTVGPIREDADDLRSCYETVLSKVKQEGFKTVAFCCVSAGIFGFPLTHASHIAISTVRRWLEVDGHADLVDRIIFCVYLKNELDVYEELLPIYFPRNSPQAAH